MNPDQNRCEFLLDQQVVDGNASLARASAPLRRCDAIHSYLRAVANTVQPMRGRSVAKLYRIVEKKRGIWTWLSLLPSNQSTMQGHLEPSSSATGVRCSAAFAMIMRPTRLLPERHRQRNIRSFTRRLIVAHACPVG
jgi:hypothetical protein